VRVKSPMPALLDGWRALGGVLNVSEGEDGAFELSCAIGADCRAEIAELAVGQGCGLLEMRPLVMGLEEIFIKLTQAEENAEGVEKVEEVKEDA